MGGVTPDDQSRDPQDHGLVCHYPRGPEVLTSVYTNAERTQCCTQHAWCSRGGAMLLQCVESTRTSRHHASRYPPKDEMGGVTQMTRVVIPRIMVSWVITPMASIVIPGSCVQPLERGEGMCAHTLHAQEEQVQCMCCRVHSPWTMRRRRRMTCSMRSQDPCCGSLHRWPAS